MRNGWNTLGCICYCMLCNGEDSLWWENQISIEKPCYDITEWYMYKILNLSIYLSHTHIEKYPQTRTHSSVNTFFWWCVYKGDKFTSLSDPELLDFRQEVVLFSVWSFTDLSCWNVEKLTYFNPHPLLIWANYALTLLCTQP